MLVTRDATVSTMHGAQRVANNIFIKARPLPDAGQPSHYLVALTDISYRKRKSIYEERLFKKLVGSLGGIYSARNSIADFDLRILTEIISCMQSGLCERLRQVPDCFSLQRAETNTLEVCIRPLDVDDVIKFVLDRV